jgi:plasmid stability protein
MKQERRITVKCTEALHKAVRLKAAELGRPISEIVRGLLTSWVLGEIEVPTKQEIIDGILAELRPLVADEI